MNQPTFAKKYNLLGIWKLVPNENYSLFHKVSVFVNKNLCKIQLQMFGNHRTIPLMHPQIILAIFGTLCALEVFDRNLAKSGRLGGLDPPNAVKAVTSERGLSPRKQKEVCRKQVGTAIRLEQRYQWWLPFVRGGHSFSIHWGHQRTRQHWSYANHYLN